MSNLFHLMLRRYAGSRTGDSSHSAQCTIIFCCVKSMDEKSEETTNEIREELVKFQNLTLLNYLKSFLKVVTAVKFLQNSKVVGSSLETKKSFLLNKGLTAKEIEAAFHRLSSTSVQYGSSPSELPSQMMIPQNSFSSRLRDLLNILLLIGGFSYGARYIWKVSFKTK